MFVKKLKSLGDPDTPRGIIGILQSRDSFMKQSHSIAALARRDNAAFNLLYKFYYPDIEKFVKQNSGMAADAEDVFQETIMVLLEKVPQQDFVLTSSIRTYINAVARNLWLKRLRDSRRTTRLEMDHDLEDFTLTEWEQKEEKRLNQNRLQRIFTRLTRHCVVFLTRTFLSGASREQLMVDMGYRNTHTFDNQKYKCLEQARRKDPLTLGD